MILSENLAKIHKQCLGKYHGMSIIVNNQAESHSHWKFGKLIGKSETSRIIKDSIYQIV